MSFFEECTKWFETKNLYDILGIEKSAKQKDIKKAYHKISLKTHPDRVHESKKNDATMKFQVLGKVYSILSDKNKRAVYDDTGSVDDDLNENIEDWLQFWRSMFRMPTKADIEKHSAAYWGSEEESKDLKKLYLNYKGDLNKIVDEMYCRPLEHEEGYKKIIQTWIDKEEVPAFKAFTNEPKTKAQRRHKKYEKEKKEAEEMEALRDLNSSVGSSKDSLANIIARRTADRRKMQGDFLSSLEAKYAKPTKKTKKDPKAKPFTKKRKRV